MSKKQKPSSVDLPAVVPTKAGTLSDQGREQLKQKLQLLTDEKNKLQKVKETPFKTNKQLNINGVNIVIDQEKDQENLLKAMAAILASEHFKKQAVKELGIKNAPKEIKIGGYKVADWKYDIKLQLVILSQEEKRKFLEQYLKEFEGFLTEEDRLMAKIEEFQQGSEKFMEIEIPEGILLENVTELK